MVEFLKASTADAEVLTTISKQCFDDDSRRWLGQSGGGPPGYDSVEWQQNAMNWGDYFKIVVDGEIVGGIIVTRQGPGHYEIGRIYLDSAYQNQGIGTQAMRFIEEQYPLATKLTLDTPAWAKRNHHFYEKLGYRRIGEVAVEEFNLILYEKRPLKSI